MSNTSPEAQAAAPAVTPERILQFAWAYAFPLVLEAAVHHRVFDALDSGAKSLSEVSQITGASERGLSAIMNLLVGVNLLAREGEKYALTPESSAFLVTTKPAYQGAFLRHMSQDLIPQWLHLNEVVGTGMPSQAVNKEKSGGHFFEHFVVDILPMSFPTAQDLGAHLDLGKIGGTASVLDLATGSGSWGIALAHSAPNVQVRAVDWPEVIPVTQKTTARFGVADRFTFVEGDLLEADFGTGHHVATLGHILHSEGRERSRALLNKTFHALASGGTIAIGEFLVNPDRTGPVGGLIFAINMLVNTENGDTYSFEEISGWLTEAGFVNARLLEVRGPSPLILATKP